MIEEIIVGFSTPKKPTIFSRTIQFVERTPYSHAYLKFHLKRLDRQVVYHAAEWNVHLRSYENFKDSNIVLSEFIIPVSEEEKSMILRYCIDVAGNRYSIGGVIGLGLIRLAKLLGREIPNYWADGGKTMYCNELVSNVLYILGFAIDPYSSERTGPRWLFDKLLSAEAEHLMADSLTHEIYKINRHVPEADIPSTDGCMCTTKS